MKDLLKRVFKHECRACGLCMQDFLKIRWKIKRKKMIK